MLIYRTSGSDAQKNDISQFWRNVTEDFFKYSQTLRVYYDSQDNPFATPSDVYTNVSGGLGIFHIYHEMSMSSKHTNHDDYFHAKREFDNTKDKKYVVNSM